MELTFLGTGTSQGIPVIGCDCEVCNSDYSRDNRLRTSAMISVDNKNFVIDVGPDFRQQMLRENVGKIEAVLLTHEHNDHVIGLDDIRPYNFMLRKGIDVYGTERVIREVTHRFPYVFEDNPYPGAPQVTTHLINPMDLFEVEGVWFQSLPVLHGDWPVVGFKTGSLVYITDAKYISEDVIAAAKNCEVLVLNALRKKEHHSHLSLEEAVGVSRKIGARRTYFTHVSHNMGLHSKVQSELPPGFFLAWDGLKVKVE